ncbi:hypothetical protein BH09MYX1_BH09MYX1_32910 [soil metagenome]
MASVDRRGSLSAWVPFVLGVAVPAALVAAIAWRARSASIVEAEKEGDSQIAAAASAAEREMTGHLAEAQKLVRALPEHGYPQIMNPPPGAEAFVVDDKGELVLPAPPRADEKATTACTEARDALLGENRAPARDDILAHCTDLKSASGRYLWPLLALATDSSVRMPEWVSAHGDRLGQSEREVLKSRFMVLEPALRDRAIAALVGPPSDYLTLRTLLDAGGDETFDGVLRIRQGGYVAVMRTFEGAMTGGLVFHEASILRAPPVLPADLVLLPGVGASGTSVTITRGLVLHVAPRDAAAARALTTRSGNGLFGLALASVLASITLAAILYARFLAARRLADLRTDFVAAVSHELRTPLASVQMLAELLEDGQVPDDERAEVEQTLARETRRLSDTLNRMLRFGALTRGKLSADTKRCVLAPIASDAAARFRQAQPGLLVNVDVDEGLEAAVDAGLIVLALDKLLNNAAKYARDGAPYQLGMKRAGTKVVISVTDTGPGLDRRAQERVFLPFERADDRLSRATEGTGVGLSLVRGIARAHGGDAHVESTLGKGSTFILEIPWKPS